MLDYVLCYLCLIPIDYGVCDFVHSICSINTAMLVPDTIHANCHGPDAEAVIVPHAPFV